MNTPVTRLILSDDPQVRRGTDGGPAGVLSGPPERREHRYTVTFPEGTRPESGQRITLVCHPDELRARLDASWPLREHPLTIVDETAAAEWMPEWRKRLTARDNTGAVLDR